MHVNLPSFMQPWISSCDQMLFEKIIYHFFHLLAILQNDSSPTAPSWCKLPIELENAKFLPNSNYALIINFSFICKRILDPFIKVSSVYINKWLTVLDSGPLRIRQRSIITNDCIMILKHCNEKISLLLKVVPQYVNYMYAIYTVCIIHHLYQSSFKINRKQLLLLTETFNYLHLID